MIQLYLRLCTKDEMQGAKDEGKVHVGHQGPTRAKGAYSRTKPSSNSKSNAADRLRAMVSFQCKIHQSIEKSGRRNLLSPTTATSQTNYSTANSTLHHLSANVNHTLNRSLLLFLEFWNHHFEHSVFHLGRDALLINIFGKQ